MAILYNIARAGSVVLVNLFYRVSVVVWARAIIMTHKIEEGYDSTICARDIFIQKPSFAGFYMSRFGSHYH